MPLLRVDTHEPKPSPKRKRTDSTTLSAADVLFAPSLPPSQSAATTSSSSSSSLPSTSPAPSPIPGLSLTTTAAIASAPPDVRVHTETLLIHPQEDNETFAGADSPRSAVARKLEGLDLALRSGTPLPILSFGDAWSKGGERKKPRLGSDVEQPLDTDPLNVRAGAPMKPTRAKSPQLAAATAVPGEPEESSVDWWSDAEITGHLGTDPDDDGYGINGIGFRPTPAMAAARSVKRRRQVDEWRSRELREERKRRAEGRRGPGSADPGGGVTRRHVTFA